MLDPRFKKSRRTRFMTALPLNSVWMCWRSSSMPQAPPRRTPSASDEEERLQLELTQQRCDYVVDIPAGHIDSAGLPVHAKNPECCSSQASTIRSRKLKHSDRYALDRSGEVPSGQPGVGFAFPLPLVKPRCWMKTGI